MSKKGRGIKRRLERWIYNRGHTHHTTKSESIGGSEDARRIGKRLAKKESQKYLGEGRNLGNQGMGPFKDSLEIIWQKLNT